GSADIMIGWGKVDHVNKRFVFASLGFVRDVKHSLKPRMQLDETDEALWSKGFDPWAVVWVVMLVDPKTAEQFVLPITTAPLRDMLASAQEVILRPQRSTGRSFPGMAGW